MKNDDENELTVKDHNRREQFKKDNPDLVITIMNASSDKPNANGIVYSKEALKKAMDDFQKRVQEKNLLVFDNMDECCDHNDLMRAGALVTNVEIDNDKINAKIRILNTISGERISTCLKHDMSTLRTKLSEDYKIIGIYADPKTVFPK